MGGVGRGRGRGGAGVSIPSGLGYGRQRGGSSGTLNAMCCKTCAVPLTVSYLLPVSTYIPKVEHGDGRSEEATLSPLGSTETWRFGGKDGTSCVREARGGMMGRGQNAPSWALPRRRVARENRPQVPRSVGRRSKLLPKASATPSPRPGRAHAPAARSLAQACFSSPKTRESRVTRRLKDPGFPVASPPSRLLLPLAVNEGRHGGVTVGDFHKSFYMSSPHHDNQLPLRKFCFIPSWSRVLASDSVRYFACAASESIEFPKMVLLS